MLLLLYFPETSSNYNECGRTDHACNWSNAIKATLDESANALVRIAAITGIGFAVIIGGGSFIDAHYKVPGVDYMFHSDWIN